MLKKYLPRIFLLLYLSAWLAGTRSHAPDYLLIPLSEKIVDKNDPCEKELRKQHIYWSTLNQFLGYYPHCLERESLRFAERIYLYAYALKGDNPKLSEDFLSFSKNYSKNFPDNPLKARLEKPE